MTAKDPGGLQAALKSAAANDEPATTALMRILMEAPNEAEARRALIGAIALQETSQAEASERLRAVEAVWRDHPDAWRLVRSMIGGIAHEPLGASPQDMPRYWAGTFDRLVDASPEASVALYSLGDPALLAAATSEIVDCMAAWGLLGASRDALDLGCGIGRFVAALAPRMRSIVGLDISPRMIAEARRRCGHLDNVRLAQTSGLDLKAVPDRSVDLVLAADVFPYLVLSGHRMVRIHFAEMRRVVRPGGHVLILNYSYRNDRDADRRDIEAGAAAYGFRVERNGTHDFRLWDGVSFLLGRRPGQRRSAGRT